MKKLENLEGCLSGSFALITTLLLTAVIIVGCSATRQVTQLVEHVQKDTLYLSNVQYDSIYVYQGFEKEYRRDFHQPSTLNPQPLVDTVYLKDLSVEYRYKLLRDTVRIVQRDSIPYEITITEVKEIQRPLTWYDHLSRFILWLNIGFVLLLVIRFIRKFHKP